MKTFPRALLKAGLVMVLAFPGVSVSQLLWGIAPSGGAALLSGGLGISSLLRSDWAPGLVPFQKDMRELAQAAAASWRSASRAVSRVSSRRTSWPAAAPAGIMIPGRGWLLMPPPDPLATR